MDPAAKKSAPSLKTRALHGSMWSTVGFGGSQLLRLLSNLLLTRLLFPEVFGIIALVQVVLQGIKMFSDVGIATSIVRDSRGDEADYLNTAWTLQAIRGGLIWLVSCLFAYPASILYHSPDLITLIPAIGFTAVIQGFNAPGVMTLRRHMDLRGLLVWELLTQIVSVATTVVLAWQYQSIWAIPIGGIVGALFGYFSSYPMSQSGRCKFRLEPSALSNILSFGKWIFLSTALTFLVRQGDILVLGTFLSKEQLGMFSIAAIWSKMIFQLVLKINNQVMMPLYAMVYREDKKSIKNKIRKGRLTLLAATLPLVWITALGGQFLIDILYDSRYVSAGWMLQILSIGAVGSVITATAGSILLSFGDSFSFMLFQVSRAVLLVGCMLLGGYYFNTVGLIVGAAFSNIISYPCLAIALHRHKVWIPSLDLGAFGLSAVVIVTGLWITNGITVVNN